MLNNWFARHRNPRNLILHLVGILQVVAAVPVAICAGVSGPNWLWIMAAVLFIDGYVLQFAGHRIEGNDAGEIIMFKKLLGMPYKALADEITNDETGMTNQ